MVGKIVLRHAVPWAHSDATFVAIHVYAPDGGAVMVTLFVKADGEEEYDLGIGDTFSVHGETWALDRVENHLSPNYRVFLRKVG
ncbi:DUF6406 domain-containing protein [Streptomyces sp. NPDC048387]|uniref:DUF6406 domain-containing protein n=1 Tax=Streptomyces sp. NPDC048387 TaxID=3365542 RepID=UPI0037128D17